MNIVKGDALELIKTLENNSIDLVLTSPPYIDAVNYGSGILNRKSNEYSEWIIPLLIDIERVLKSSGSFILNINDKCENGYRSTYIYNLIYEITQRTNLKLYDTYFWHKRNAVPNGSKKRFRTTTEFIFHFSKSTSIQFYMDRVMEKTKSIKDSRTRTKYSIDENGKTIRTAYTDGVPTLELKRPDNVFRFKTAPGNGIKHPASFHKDLPLYFINLLTNENDLVLDPFSGIGTTGIACKELNRNYIGFELNPEYADYSIERINNHK